MHGKACTCIKLRCLGSPPFPMMTNLQISFVISDVRLAGITCPSSYSTQFFPFTCLTNPHTLPFCRLTHSCPFTHLPHPMYFTLVPTPLNLTLYLSTPPYILYPCTYPTQPCPFTLHTYPCTFPTQHYPFTSTYTHPTYFTPLPTLPNLALLTLLPHPICSTPLPTPPYHALLPICLTLHINQPSTKLTQPCPRTYIPHPT